MGVACHNRTGVMYCLLCVAWSQDQTHRADLVLVRFRFEALVHILDLIDPVTKAVQQFTDFLLCSMATQSRSSPRTQRARRLVPATLSASWR